MIKPFPRFRSRVPKRMTLVAGFQCRDGLLICADMEEVSGSSSRRISKLIYREAIGISTLVITGAGSGPVIDNAVDRIWSAATKKPFAYDAQKMQDLITRVLTTVHKKYIWPDPRTDHSVSLIIGYSDPTGMHQALWVTHDLVPMPEVKFVCAGVGEDLAKYWADKLWDPYYSEAQAVRVASFIFREVKSNVRDVGQGTEFWMLRKGGDKKKYSYQEVEVYENGLPSFQWNVLQHRRHLTGPTLFPQLPFTLDVPYVEISEADKDGVLRGPDMKLPKLIRKLAFK
jgi:20S proteasome alpha/beta subunit